MHHRIVSGSFDRQTNWRRLHGLHKVVKASLGSAMAGFYFIEPGQCYVRTYLPTYLLRSPDRSFCAADAISVLCGQTIDGGWEGEHRWVFVNSTITLSAN